MPSPSEQRLPFEAPIYEMEARLAEMEAQYAKNRPAGDTTKIAEQIRRLRRELAALKREIYSPTRPLADRPGLAAPAAAPDPRLHRPDLRAVRRAARRPRHRRRQGDRHRAWPTSATSKVMFIGHQKGKNLAERTACNFGCAHPEGYRKALLKMRLAAKFGLPIITFIDTPGRLPGDLGRGAGPGGDHRREPDGDEPDPTRPIVCVVIGEGGSGGALGIGIGDRLAMLEHTLLLGHQPRGLRHDPLERRASTPPRPPPRSR